MSTTIYDSPDEFKRTIPNQGSLSIDITISTVWFFEHDEDGEIRETVTFPLAQLPAVAKAINDYLDWERDPLASRAEEPTKERS